MKLLLIFIILNIANVIIQTIKSICTIKCGKGVAALVNAIAYGLYTIVTVYMLCDLDLWLKALIVAMCNLVGVYVVKLIEEKTRKDKLWKIETTVLKGYTKEIAELLIRLDIPFNYIEGVGKYTVFNIFCATQNQSSAVKEILAKYRTKYFVTESKNL
jgi:uncharacterized protein YebE (UPF0316 family)